MRLLILISFVALAVASRFLPLEPNFSPIMALALFSGAYFTDKKQAWLVPMAAMFVSDLFLGFHWDMFAVYGSFALIIAMGRMLKNVNVLNVVASSLAGAVVFFVITNFSVWLTSGFYEYSFAGLINCYEMAIPFFRNTISSSLLYSAVMFGSYEVLSRMIPELKPLEVK